MYPNVALGRCCVQLYVRFSKGIWSPFNGNLIIFLNMIPTEGSAYLFYRMQLQRIDTLNFKV